jgi:hypothetical protein
MATFMFMWLFLSLSLRHFSPMLLWPCFCGQFFMLLCAHFFANKKNYILAVGVGVCTLLLCGRRLDLQQGNEINVWLGGKIFISSINFF